MGTTTWPGPVNQCPLIRSKPVQAESPLNAVTGTCPASPATLTTWSVSAV